jgi:hypothetical protein
MSEEKFELTTEEIRCLQELADGWETIWDRISVELYGKNGNGRLHDATRRYRSNNPGVDIDDFISFIYEQYHKEVLNQTRFLTYNYEEYGGDIFKFLCNSSIIGQMFTKYRRENTLIKTPTGQEAKEIINDGSFGDEETSYIANTVASPNTQAVYYDEDNTTLPTDNLVLAIPVPKSTGSFSKEYEQAGLQLYPRIDYTDMKMETLQKHVHNTVAQSDKSNTRPNVKIQREHQFAKERIDEEMDKLREQFYDYKKQKKRNIDSKLEKNIKRKIDKKHLQAIYRPLNAEQIIELLVISRANADKILSRYYKILTDILPLQEETKEQFRPSFDLVFKNEGEKNDD